MKIISRDEYIDMIVNLSGASTAKNDDKTLTPEQRRRLFLALTYALKNRKNEIELYWKRAQYFWGFLVTIYGGYLFVFKSEMSDHFLQSLALFSISLIGYFFSVGWCLSNRGSAFWQENWEFHVRELEKEVHGPLHSIIATNVTHYKAISLDAPFPYSVNKINCVLSSLFVVLGFSLTTLNFCKAFNVRPDNLPDLLIIFVFSIGTIILSWCFSRYVQKSCVTQCKKNSSDQRHPIFFSDHNTKN